MRFCVIISRNIAVEKRNLDYARFLDSVIDDMTHEISMLNKSMLDGSIDDVLKQLTFHEKVNIIFYVRKDFYDKELEPYEILDEKTYKKLSKSIINQANDILSDYKLSLNNVKSKSISDLYVLLNNNELVEDILFASELL